MTLPPDISFDRRQLVRRVGISLCVCIALLFAAYITIRLRAIANLQVQFVALHTEHRGMQQTYEAMMRESAYRIDEIEKALFGEVMGKLAQQKSPGVVGPSRIEAWQINRDRAFREAMQRYHLQLLDHEARIKRLEDFGQKE